MRETISNERFLDQIGMLPTPNHLDLVGRLREALSEFSTRPGMLPPCILPGHRIESDLGIHHLDSLDLVDVATSIEIAGFQWAPDDLPWIAELNRRDGTVYELASRVLDASRRVNPPSRPE